MYYIFVIYINISFLKRITKIYNKYFDELVMFGLYYTSNKQDIEDAISHIFEKILEDPKKLPDEKKVKKYLFISLKHFLLNLQRKEKVRSKYQMQYEHDIYDVSIDDQIEQAEIESILYCHINQLPTKQREIVLSTMNDLSRKEIAKLHNVSEETIKTQKRSAISKLRTALKSKILFFLF